MKTCSVHQNSQACLFSLPIRYASLFVQTNFYQNICSLHSNHRLLRTQDSTKRNARRYTRAPNGIQTRVREVQDRKHILSRYHRDRSNTNVTAVRKQQIVNKPAETCWYYEGGRNVDRAGIYNTHSLACFLRRSENYVLISKIGFNFQLPVITTCSALL